MRKQKETLREKAQRIGGAMDLPAQLLPDFCHLELWQNRQAAVEGVKGVLSYSETEIQLNLGSLVATFRGVELAICSFQAEQLTMSGTIAEVQFTT